MSTLGHHQPGNQPPPVPRLASGVSCAEALARRSEATKARREAVQAVKTGKMEPIGLLGWAALDGDVAKITLLDALVVVGWSKLDAEAALARVGVKPARRMAWLFTMAGYRHQEAFAGLLAQRGRPEPPPGWPY